MDKLDIVRLTTLMSREDAFIEVCHVINEIIDKINKSKKGGSNWER